MRYTLPGAAKKMISAIVLDIEGTICPISFVKDVLFPFARSKIDSIVAHDLQKARKLGTSTFPFPNYLSDYDLVQLISKSFPIEDQKSPEAFLDAVHTLMDNDVKASYLKELQGYLWQFGYKSGEIQSPLYPDAVAAIRNWNGHAHANSSSASSSLPIKVYIYSSGSVEAQKLMFEHSDHGNLLSEFSGYFDTVNAGSKLESSSYDTIASQIKTLPSEILFLTDNTKEIDAATAAGWNCRLAIRPGNAPVTDPKYTATAVDNFASIDLSQF